MRRASWTAPVPGLVRMCGRGREIYMDPSWRSALAVAFALIGSAGAQPGAAEPPAARVELFSPRGTAKQVRQVTARFSVPMVALGDPRLADPFTVDCAAPGKGRWADTRSWVYDFDADLSAGLRCTFTLVDGLAAADRRAIAGERAFAFDTGGPAIVASLPNDGWEEIDEGQVFLLKLDAPAVADTIARHAHCAIDGVAERVPVELLAGEARRALLDARKQLGYGYFSLLWKSGDVSDLRVRDRTLEQAEELVVALRCQRRLPPATQVRLVWGAGIAAASGIATKQDQQLAFAVRKAFLATLECTRTEPRAGCTPTQPITVKFSAPVAREQAMAALRRPRRGRAPRQPGGRSEPRARDAVARGDRLGVAVRRERSDHAARDSQARGRAAFRSGRDSARRARPVRGRAREPPARRVAA